MDHLNSSIASKYCIKRQDEDMNTIISADELKYSKRSTEVEWIWMNQLQKTMKLSTYHCTLYNKMVTCLLTDVPCIEKWRHHQAVYNKQVLWEIHGCPCIALCKAKNDAYSYTNMHLRACERNVELLKSVYRVYKTLLQNEPQTFVCVGLRVDLLHF